jgi:hypothetical protein
MTTRRFLVGGLGLALLVVLAAGSAMAGDKGKEVTVSGNLQCAKCTLKAADATKCQDVLVVEGTGGAPATEYYLVKNAVAEKFGHVCTGTKSVALTGTVTEKDGKKWLTAKRIDEKKS